MTNDQQWAELFYNIMLEKGIHSKIIDYWLNTYGYHHISIEPSFITFTSYNQFTNTFHLGTLADYSAANNEWTYYLDGNSYTQDQYLRIIKLTVFF